MSMRQKFQMIGSAMELFGLNFDKTVRSIQAVPAYFNDLKILNRQQANAQRRFALGKPFPCFEDKRAESGTARGHYFHQDLLVAHRIFLNRPKIHVDVGSRIDGFVAHVASFRSIRVIDIRKLTVKVPNIVFIQADLMSELETGLTECCDSLSCLHALEHFGLGRYGDPIQYDGYLVGLRNLHGLLAKHGTLYFSVPIGPQRIEFNAHRVFSVEYLLELFKDKFRISRFSFVDDNGDLHDNVMLSIDDISQNFGCSFGCGIFEMTRL